MSSADSNPVAYLSAADVGLVDVGLVDEAVDAAAVVGPTAAAA